MIKDGRRLPIKQHRPTYGQTYVYAYLKTLDCQPKNIMVIPNHKLLYHQCSLYLRLHLKHTVNIQQHMNCTTHIRSDDSSPVNETLLLRLRDSEQKELRLQILIGRHTRDTDVLMCQWIIIIHNLVIFFQIERVMYDRQCLKCSAQTQ